VSGWDGFGGDGSRAGSPAHGPPIVRGKGRVLGKPFTIKGVNPGTGKIVEVVIVSDSARDAGIAFC